MRLYCSAIRHSLDCHDNYKQEAKARLSDGLERRLLTGSSLTGDSVSSPPPLPFFLSPFFFFLFLSPSIFFSRQI